MNDSEEPFHKHLDECAQCREHPFRLCARGTVLIKAVLRSRSVKRGKHEHIGELTIDRAQGIEYCEECDPALLGPHLLNWYVILNSERCVLAVYGSALRVEANNELARLSDLASVSLHTHNRVKPDVKLVYLSGSVSLHQFNGVRPNVGDTLLRTTLLIGDK